VLGTYLAVAATTLFIGNKDFSAWLVTQAQSWGITDPHLGASVPWRLGFAVGALPALLIIWIRASLREPAEWQRAREDAAKGVAQETGRISELFGAGLRRNTLVGFGLAAIGLATFWGVHIHGKSTMRLAGQRIIESSANPISDAEKAAALKRWDNLGMFLVTTGGGLGLIAFGPISQQLGRRLGFALYHVGGLASGLGLFGWLLRSPETLTPGVLYFLLPVFGFLTLGLHAGYAIYFPELFPTRLRGTGSGFCFNGGRFAAAPILFLSGWLQRDGLHWGPISLEPIGLAKSCLWLSTLYLLGLLVLSRAPETRPRSTKSLV
jgi:hypothetical protein